MKVQIRQAELDLQRTQGLAARKLASQADLDRAQLTLEGLAGAARTRARRTWSLRERSAAVQRQLLDDMEIRAPFTGVVVAKAAQPGEMISPISAGGGFTRTGICTIVDMDSLEVEVDVNEAYINRVQPKQPVAVALNAYPDERIPAEVIAIIPTADRNKATVRVRIALLEKNPRVLPDMGVKVAFLERWTRRTTSAANGVQPACVNHYQGVTMSAIVSLSKVSKSYVRGKQEVVVLRDLDLSIEAGDFVALMGPSGSGKTTLLNLIGGLDQPTRGSITVAGQTARNAERQGAREMARARTSASSSSSTTCCRC